MRIMHLPLEIAGQIGALCGSMQTKGHFARGYNFFSTYLKYKDFLINSDAFEMGRMFEEAIRQFDLFHYHYGLTLYPRYKDLELLRNAGKPMVMHHWGSDVRMASLANLYNPYAYTGDSQPEESIRQSLSVLGGYFTDAIVQDDEVRPYVEPYYRRVHVIPLAIDVSRFPVAYPSVTETNPLVVHAPTNQEFKGTADIEKAIEALSKELTFQYVRVEKLSHEEAVQWYQKADIVIDQIRCGSYGLLSVEAMAYGKPVVAYIRPDLLGHFGPDLPIASANPDTIYYVLGDLIRSPERRFQLGLAGRRYVEERHDSLKIADRVLEVYRLAMQDLGI